MTEYPTQEFLHDPANGSVGDCYRACIAGLISAALEDVPHFARDHEDDWWDQAVARVERDDPALTLICAAPTFPVYVEGGWPVAIATGPSPRGDFHHAVLVDPVDGTLVWDPHPSRDGLAGPIIEVHAIVSKEQP